LVLCATAVVFAAEARAQETQAHETPVQESRAPESPDDAAATASDWGGSVTVYGWLPWLNTDVTAPSGAEADITYSADDILDALQFAAFAKGEVHRNRVFGLTDVVYASLSNNQRLSGPLQSDVNADIKMLLWTFGAGYRAYEDDRFTADIFGGGRLYYFDVDLEATGGGPAGRTRSASSSTTVVDPIIGVRGSVDLTERWAATALVDIGGFGVGTEFTWEAFGGVSYAFTPRVVGELGFRYLSIDYDNDNDELDLDMQLYGPALGLTIRF
jgi:hypothetical protein